jgi:hypothetical protein
LVSVVSIEQMNRCWNFVWLLCLHCD